MKSRVSYWSGLILSLLFCCLGAKELAAQEEISFVTALPVNSEIRLEINADGEVVTEGLRFVRSEQMQGITFSYYTLLSQEVKLKGAILELDCSDQEITQLDLSQAARLQTLFAYKNKLTSIDLGSSSALDFVDLSYNELTSVEIPALPRLQRLALYNNRLEELSIGSCPQLSYLDIHGNQLAQSVCEALPSHLPQRDQAGTLVAVDNTQQEGNKYSKQAVETAKEKGWEVFDYNGSPFSMKPYRGFDYVPQVSDRLITLSSAKPQSSEISITIRSDEPYRIEGAEILSEEKYFSGEAHLKLRLGGSGTILLYGDILSLDCSQAELTQLTFSTESLISSLICKDNALERLDLTGLKLLKQLDCRNNKLVEIQLSADLPLLLLSVANNKLSEAKVASLVSALATSDDENLFRRAIVFDSREAVRDGNRFSADIVSQLKDKGFTPLAIVNDEEQLIYYKGWDYTPQIASGRGVTFKTNRAVGEMLLVEITPVAGEDCSVSGATLLYLDAPGDTPYEVYRVDKELITIAGSVAKLDLGDCGVTMLDCSQAPSLTELLLVKNPQLQALDLTANKKIETLQIVGCGIATIDARSLTNLRRLYAGYSALREVDLSQCEKLETLNMDKLQLTELSLASNKRLKSLSCSENNLTELDLSAHPYLEDLDCSRNALTRLTLPQEAPLLRLEASHNKLQSIPLGTYPNLQQLACYDNKIDTLHASSLFASLPSRPNGSRGRLLFCDSSIETEGNSAYQRDVAQGETKNWLVLDFNGSPTKAKRYKGVPNPNPIEQPLQQSWVVAQVGRELQIRHMPIGEELFIFSPMGALLYRTTVREEVTSIDITDYPPQIVLSAMGHSRVVALSRGE